MRPLKVGDVTINRNNIVSWQPVIRGNVTTKIYAIFFRTVASQANGTFDVEFGGDEAKRDSALNYLDNAS